MLRRLLEYEVPEIYNGQVEIKSIAREAGHRSKVAVSALQPGVDPVGACVGLRGMRIQNIVKELNDEKIDVIEWNPDQAIFIAKALSPARVSAVYLEDDIDQGHTAIVIVPDDQLSLAIGREGQNARLAAKLTGWRIDIKSVTEAATSAIGLINAPSLSKLATEQPDVIAEVERILEKKRSDRAVMPEEYQTLGRFAQMAEQRLLEHRESERSKRRKAMDKVRPNVPASAFEMQLEELELADDIMQALKPIANVGDLMVRLQADEDKLRAKLKEANAGDDAMDAIKEAITSLVVEQPQEATEAAPVAVTGEEPVAAVEPIAETPQAEPTAETPVAAVSVAEDEDTEAPPAFIDEEPVPAAPRRQPVAPTAPPAPRREPRPPAPEPQPQAAAPENIETASDDDESDDRKGGKKGKKGKNRRRELVFDERRGEVVSKRKRKGGRSRDWGDFEE
jgi:N utilization substance protein A